MSAFWQRWFEKQSPQRSRPMEAPADKPPSSPPRPLKATQPDQAGKGNPNSFQAGAAGGAGINRPDIFDPALKHFPRAFRQGDPRFEDPAVRQQWRDARRHVIAHLLRTISGSRWKDHLVLRGSLLLQAWLGELAREPGDIDWIFRPEIVGLNDHLAQDMLGELRSSLENSPMAGPAIIEVDKIALDDIWTYERAAGKRIVLPWLSENLPHGNVQMDITFREQLLDDPQETGITTIDGDAVSLLAASAANHN